MSFDSYFNQVLLKKELYLKRLCAPLKDCLNIPLFGYFYLDKDGRYCNLVNALKLAEYYYGSHLYAHDPYISHPNFFRKEFAIIQLTCHTKLQQILEEKYQWNCFFQILYKYENHMEGFIFAQRNQKYSECIHFFEKIYPLEKFAEYFKSEAKESIQQVLGLGYNMKKVLGSQFDQPPLRYNLKEEIQFLKRIDLLSSRERQCVELYKEGHSAQSSAAKLRLSQRTVEHYLDNAKLKLGYTSKREFLG